MSRATSALLYHALFTSVIMKKSDHSSATGILNSIYSKNRLKEGTEVSLRSLQRLCAKFQRMHTIQDLHRASKLRILTPEIVTVMDESLRSDDEMTARKLKSKLGEKFVELPEVSLSTIKRQRKEMGWICTRPHYYQLIREVNKLKRKEWCKSK